MTRYWKRCPGCGEERIIADFYRNASNPDGLQGRCKACSRAMNRASYRKHAAVRRAHDIERYRNDPIRRASVNSRIRDMTKKYPERAAARHAINNAVHSGKIRRMPCEVCGSKKSQGHHEDYSRPLQVRWLCQQHHEQLHHEGAI